MIGRKTIYPKAQIKIINGLISDLGNRREGTGDVFQRIDDKLRQKLKAKPNNKAYRVGGNKSSTWTTCSG